MGGKKSDAGPSGAGWAVVHCCVEEGGELHVIVQAESSTNPLQSMSDGAVGNFFEVGELLGVGEAEAHEAVRERGLAVAQPQRPEPVDRRDVLRCVCVCPGGRLARSTGLRPPSSRRCRRAPPSWKR